MTDLLATVSALVPQPAEAFFLGCVVIAFAQISRYRLIRVRDEGLQEWVALLGPLRTRDFSGPHGFALGAGLFVTVSLVAYVLLCNLSPETVIGFGKLLGIGADALAQIESAPLPIYFAALFLGVTSLSGERGLQVFQLFTDFFQDRIDVPTKVVESAARIARKLRVECQGDRALLEAWMARLSDDRWLPDQAGEIDIDFARARIAKLTSARRDAAGELSAREIEAQIQQLARIWVVAGARRSGYRGVERVLRGAGLGFVRQKTDLPVFIAALVAFCVLGYGVFLLLGALDRPVAILFGTDPAVDLWDGDAKGLGSQLVSIMPPMVASMVVAVALWRRRLQWDERAEDIGTLCRPRTNLPRYAFILLVCLAGNFALLWLGQLYAWGVMGLPEAYSSAEAKLLGVSEKVILYFIQAAIPLGLAYVVLVLLDARKAGRAAPVAAATGLLLGATALVSMLSSATVLRMYFDDAGYEFVLFAVIANGLVALSVFLSFVLFWGGVEPPRRPAIAAADPVPTGG